MSEIAIYRGFGKFIAKAVCWPTLKAIERAEELGINDPADGAYEAVGLCSMGLLANIVWLWAVGSLASYAWGLFHG